ncbi:MAG: hypothetical protein K8R92_11095 [Planctomycetes bacterium]|nr:hypothetical protein [Planctomycetota bacterium]
MVRSIAAVIFLALGAGCATAGSTPDQAIRQQAVQEKAGPAQALAPPTFMSVKSAKDPATATMPLAAAESILAPARPGEGAPAAEEEAEPQWLAKIRTHVRQRELDQAMQQLLAQVRSDPQNTLAWREMARLFEGAGRRDTALSAWNQLLSLSPNDAEAAAASGLDFLAAKKFLPAAERLLLGRRLLAAEPSKAGHQKLRIAASAGLGLALGELGYPLAASECFHEAAALEQASIAEIGATERPLRRQSREFLRFAGEFEASAGRWEAAANSFSAALAQSDAADATSLPPLVWALACSGRTAAARQAVLDALEPADRPGRAGAPSAVAWLAQNGWAQPLQEFLRSAASKHDEIAARCLLASGDEDAAEMLFESAPRVLEDSIALQEAAGFLASRQGVAAVVHRAVASAETDPESARRWALALRTLPISARQLRGALREAPASEGTRALLTAYVDLAGFDSLLALRTIEPFIAEPGALGSASRVAALRALATEQDLEKIERIASKCDVASCAESAALSHAFLECGEIDPAIRHAEHAIELDKNCADAWVARAAIDAALTLDPSPERTFEKRKESALEARGSLERAMTAAPGDRLAARKYLEIAAPERGLAPDDDAMETVSTSKFPQVQRESRRERALMQQRRGQSEAALEPLRLLFMEDPLDLAVGQALTAAAADAGRLPETEKFLDALQVLHPAAAELGEAALSTKARQGRLLEAIDLLTEASAADPDSDAFVRACVRSHAAAGQKSQAWGAMSRAPEFMRKAAGRSQLERIEFALSGEPDSAAEEIRGLVRGGRLSKVQRQAAVTLARQLPPDVADRPALIAALARPLLEDPSGSPLFLACVMLEGSSAEACALAAKSARAWEVAGVIEAAQLLVDERQLDRAECLLREAVRVSQGKNRSQLFRAELATLLAAADAGRARARLMEERTKHEFRFKDPASTTEAEDLAELGNAFLLASQPAAAEECFRAALELSPDLVAAMNNLAWLRMERGLIDSTTLDLVKRALAASPTDASTLDTAGWLAYRQGRLEDESGEPGGVSLLRRSLELARERASPESMDHFADALFRSGRTEEAQKLWRLIAEQASGKSSRANVVNAFQLLQQKERGIRALDAEKFYDRNDGAAIERAKGKLKAVAEDRMPELAPMDLAPAPAARPAVPPAPAPEGAK